MKLKAKKIIAREGLILIIFLMIGLISIGISYLLEEGFIMSSKEEELGNKNLQEKESKVIPNLFPEEKKKYKKELFKPKEFIPIRKISEPFRKIESPQRKLFRYTIPLILSCSYLFYVTIIRFTIWAIKVLRWKENDK